MIVELRCIAKRTELLRSPPEFFQAGRARLASLANAQRRSRCPRRGEEEWLELVFPSGGDFYTSEEDCRAMFAHFASNRVDVINVLKRTKIGHTAT